MTLRFPILLADIGGTHCRLALLERAGGAVVPVANRPSADIADLPQELLAITAGLKPQSAIFAVAGVVESPRVTLTNLPWSIDAALVGETLGLTSVLLINDFEAQAAAIAALHADDYLTLQPGAPVVDGTRLIIGAGTGFGTAFLHPCSHGFSIIPSEAGHMDVPLLPEDEQRFARAVRALVPRLDIEALVSGPGLARLHRALHANALHPPGIVAAAQEGDPGALATITIFYRLLASVSANLVMAAKATGGLWITGGVIGHILPWLDRRTFLADFIDKAPLAHLLAQIPVHIVTRADPAFAGLAAIAENPQRFGMIRPAGLWCA